MSRHPLIAVSALIVGLTIFFTWPQSIHLASQAAPHHDAYFSMWRIEWIAHALRTDSRHLFDANIFYPHGGTLAYSDAAFLEGAVAAPFVWLGVGPVAIYNVLLILGIVSSGLGMFVLTRFLTNNVAAASVAGTIFMLQPYRVEHYSHLELQWTAWIPLAFWAVHRAIELRSWRFGALAGLFVWLQILSCVYYGVFLAMLIALLALVQIAVNARARAALPVLLLGAALVALLAAPYASPYLQNAKVVGSRPPFEIAEYSATPINYLASPAQNWVWGWTAQAGASERRLFPGLLAIVLAALAFLHPRRRMIWLYSVLVAAALDLSFGLNGYSYTWLHAHFGAFRQLRAPARFAMLVLCGISVLAAFGFAWVQQKARTERRRKWVLAATLALLAVEYASAPMPLADVPVGPIDVYEKLRALERGVVVELPLPTVDRLPGHEAVYQFWSANHWRPLVNGYSGYYPQTYFDTLLAMVRFPDDESIARLRGLDVRYIIVHRGFYGRSEHAALMKRMTDRPELVANGWYRDPVDIAELFELKQ